MMPRAARPAPSRAKLLGSGTVGVGKALLPVGPEAKLISKYAPAAIPVPLVPFSQV
jgi:hypothetical protein